MIIGTTPTFRLKVADDDTLDLHNASHIYFSIRQGSIKYTKQDSDITIIDNQTVEVTLSQEETLSFRYNIDAQIQLNWIYSDGSRMATQLRIIPVEKNLIKEVLE